ncbi:uncharacterized protein LOC114964196 [Acropora millepora]|uniref:uncharacterized protein LOC114964196 n=1 Tax=Acropora millepora TaxID=45264 RepID=UPI001CF5DEF2|nr:uncharacterized protein LOC114964196 [Acropora millepora]
MPNTNQNHLKAATAVSDLPDSPPLLALLRCLKDTLKCGRQHKTFLWLVSEKRKEGISFSYRFTGLESKYFCWQVATLIQELLKIPTLSKGHVLKLHTLSFIGVQFSIYSRVEVSIEQVENLKVLCQQFFNASNLLPTDITPTVWTVGVAIPYQTSKLHQKLGYGLGLNSMQGREAKHVKFAKYVENTCNARKSLRWWTVFRHEFVCMIWLREQDPYSIAYRCRCKSTFHQFLTEVMERVQMSVALKKGQTKTIFLPHCTWDKFGDIPANSGGRSLGLFDELTAFFSTMNMYSSVKMQISDSREYQDFLQMYTKKSKSRDTSKLFLDSFYIFFKTIGSF